MPTSAQMERNQVEYSRRLAENQNAALARKEAAAIAAGRAYVRAHPTYNTDPTTAVWTLALAFFLYFVFPGVILVAILRNIARRKQRRTAPKTPGNQHSALSYRTVPSLLTPTEAHFYQTLCTAVGPLAVIQCKVRLADLLIAPRHDLTAFRRVSQKHVDFVLCERGSLKPLIAVELDDRSHEREDRRRRDQFVDAVYASAGLPLVHVQVQSVYNAAELLAQLQPFLIVDVWGRG